MALVAQQLVTHRTTLDRGDVVPVSTQDGELSTTQDRVVQHLTYLTWHAIFNLASRQTTQLTPPKKVLAHSLAICDDYDYDDDGGDDDDYDEQQEQKGPPTGRSP
eukprot:jgi/Chrzof1/3430/Cz12g25050.t1